jgi:predicted nucleic acid binding AN1-type Zn finger protein
MCYKTGCRKKIPLVLQISNKCKCNNIFCTAHRLPELHMCLYDYKTLGREVLKKNLVDVHPDKIIKI